jgi:hypothetical protein
MVPRVLAILLTAAILVVGCVPEPTNRPSPSGGGTVSTPPPTPIPTPAGPTPTPSFVRPTPTPQPTFLIYTVVGGDSLTSIAKRFGTTPQSIAYWNRVNHQSLDPDSPSYRPNVLKIGWTLQIIPNAVVDPEDLPTLPPGD